MLTVNWNRYHYYQKKIEGARGRLCSSKEGACATAQWHNGQSKPGLSGVESRDAKDMHDPQGPNLVCNGMCGERVSIGGQPQPNPKDGAPASTEFFRPPIARAQYKTQEENDALCLFHVECESHSQPNAPCHRTCNLLHDSQQNTSGHWWRHLVTMCIKMWLASNVT